MVASNRGSEGGTTAIPLSLPSTKAAPDCYLTASTAGLDATDRRKNPSARRLIETFALEEFERVAMLADKTDQSSSANIDRAAAARP